MGNTTGNDKDKKQKQKEPIPPSATFVDPSGKLEKKKGMSDSSNEGLNDSTQCSF